MAAYLPTYAEALELKAYLKEKGLDYVHFHDQCGYSYFNFDRADKASLTAAADFWQARGLKVSFQEDGLSFIVVTE